MKYERIRRIDFEKHALALNGKNVEHGWWVACGIEQMRVPLSKTTKIRKCEKLINLFIRCKRAISSWPKDKWFAGAKSEFQTLEIIRVDI